MQNLCLTVLTFRVTFKSLIFTPLTAIAGANIGLLDFYDLKRRISFLKVFFYRKYYLFKQCFELKSKSKNAV